VHLTNGPGRAKAPKADLVIVVDLGAYRRGHAHPGEVSHIVGGGPIPVGVARELSSDAFLKAVLHDGVDIRTVAHFGRRRPVELDTALGIGAPPDFDGVICAALGCDRKYGLEWDHVDPVANDGLSSAANLQPLCWPHHREKTERDRATGRLGKNRKERGP
jgi:HNH endonuclease